MAHGVLGECAVSAGLAMCIGIVLLLLHRTAASMPRQTSNSQVDPGGTAHDNTTVSQQPDKIITLQAIMKAHLSICATLVVGQANNSETIILMSLR